MKKINHIEPQHLDFWTMPANYAGDVWPGYYSAGVGQSRDSDALERANFDAVVAALDAVPDDGQDWDGDGPYVVVRENHWAVGWVEWIAISQDAPAHVAVADDIAGRCEDYPVVDDDRLSEYERADADLTWANCYDVAGRIEYIRIHDNQFEFYNLADMLGCVRGHYFSGYASELIY